MRIVIDKDVSEIQLLQESYEKSKPSYKVLAVENGEKFVYGTKIRNINEAVDAVYDIAWDENFNDCQSEIVEVFGESEHVIWSSDPKVQVCESVLFVEAGDNKDGSTANKDAKTGQNQKGFFGKLKDAAGKAAAGAKKALQGLAKGLNIVGAMTKQFSKDALKKWREGGLFNKEGRITGLGYKVMTGQVKNTIPVDTGNKNDDITQAWKVAQSNAMNALKKQGYTVNGEVKAIVKTDKDPITLSADVTDKDGNAQTIEFNQDGTMVDGGAQNAQNGGEGANANGGGNNAAGANGKDGGGAGGANTQQITPDQAQKNPKAALGNLATRVANLEREVGIAAESKWNYNNEQKFAKKDGYERQTIKRFFNEMNDESVKNIKFIRPDGTFKLYDISNGS